MGCTQNGCPAVPEMQNGVLGEREMQKFEKSCLNCGKLFYVRRYRKDSAVPVHAVSPQGGKMSERKAVLFGVLGMVTVCVMGVAIYSYWWVR